MNVGKFIECQGNRLKVHYCRFENLPISSASFENYMFEHFTLKHLLLFEACARTVKSLFTSIQKQ